MPFLTVAGGQLEYELIDLTPPWLREPQAVLFHHGIGTDMGIWASWLPALAARFRLVRFSMRGFGGSSPPPPDFAWTLDSFSDDLLALADALGIERFHLIAESFGGTVSLNAALARPERVNSLTLLSTPHRGASVMPVAAWPALTASAEGMRQWSQEMMNGRFTDTSLTPAARRWFQEVQEQTSPEVLRRLASLISRTDLTPLLPRLRAPALLMSGDASPYVGVEQIVALHKLLPASRVQIFPDARHGIAFSHPAQCARAFTCFVAGLSGPSNPEETS